MTEPTIYNALQNNFTQVSNEALVGARLSGKAYKLYAYMCYRVSLSASWIFNRSEILKHFTEGESAMRGAFNELIKAGFLERIKVRNNKGIFVKTDFKIYSTPINKGSGPQVENPPVDNPPVGKPQVENQLFNNKDKINKDKINKELILKDDSDEKILFFETFWQVCLDGTDFNLGSKKLAEEAFNKIVSNVKNPVNIVDLIFATKLWLKSCRETKERTCHITTYLNQERFGEFVERWNKIKKEQQKQIENESLGHESVKIFNDDPFWIKAKSDLLNSQEIQEKWKPAIEKFTYFGLDKAGRHTINSDSKFMRDWITREYKKQLDAIFGKWILITK